MSMNAGSLLDSLIRRKIPRATVTVDASSDGLGIRVVSDYFRGAETSERQSQVYSALERAPLELIARISSIDCYEE